jgi:hypothetical protein
MNEIGKDEISNNKCEGKKGRTTRKEESKESMGGDKETK